MMNYPINEEKAKEVIEMVKKNKIEFVDLQFTDIGGTLKRKGISAKDFESAIYKGSFFDGSSIQ
jgi:glutamine synthetase